MSDTFRDKRAWKLKQFNDKFSKENEQIRGNTNKWLKELSTDAGVGHYEIGSLFPRPANKFRKIMAKEYRAKVKAALKAGRELPIWDEVFDNWRWD